MSFTKSVTLAAVAAVAVAQNTTYTVVETSVETITSCEPTVTDCPALNHNGTAFITHTQTKTVTYCPPEAAPSDSKAAPPTAPETSAPPKKEDTPSAPATKESAPGPKESAPAPAPTSAPTKAPTPEDDTTTFVTVEEGVTVTVIGTKSQPDVEEVPTASGPVVEANGASTFGFAGLAAVAAGALLL